MTNKVYIIAEAGVNHNGSIELAKKMIEVAAQAGVDAVKFQSFKTENLVTKTAVKAEYQKISTSSSESQFLMLKKFELDIDGHKILKDHCTKNGVEFLSSPFDLDSIDLLNKLGLNLFKIPSGEINNVPFIRKIAALNKKVIFSTGMSTLGEIEFALGLLIEGGTLKENITVLHCNTEYPTPFEDVNLLAMQTIKDAFKVNVGYSDHTTGIEVPIAAIALGAQIIEKHFTLDKEMKGPDHKASLCPNELRTMVNALRNIEKTLGSGVKSPSKSELKNKDIARKSIVAACNIKRGEIFSEKNLTVKRPGNGISPIFWDDIIGKTANRDYLEDNLITI
jgi:N,N'-diacetyllegionaminate synthase